MDSRIGTVLFQNHKNSLNIYYMCRSVLLWRVAPVRQEICRYRWKKSTKAFESKMRQSSSRMNQSCSNRSQVQIRFCFWQWLFHLYVFQPYMEQNCQYCQYTVDFYDLSKLLEIFSCMYGKVLRQREF
jgi:hypothetical protein